MAKMYQVGNTENIRVDKDVQYANFGTQREDYADASLSAIAWGSDIPAGRAVIFAPPYNQAIGGDKVNPDRQVCLPDLTGQYLINPETGIALDQPSEAATLANLLVNGAPLVMGIMDRVNRPNFNTTCDFPPAWPVGYRERLDEWNYNDQGYVGKVKFHGYIWVPIAEDLAIGDEVEILTTTDNADPALGTYSFGWFAKKGTLIAGAIATPKTWTVVTGGKAGKRAEIYMGG